MSLCLTGSTCAAEQLKAKIKPELNGSSSELKRAKSESAAVADGKTKVDRKVSKPASNIDPALRRSIEGEIMSSDTNVTFASVVGLKDVKQALHEVPSCAVVNLLISVSDGGRRWPEMH